MGGSFGVCHIGSSRFTVALMASMLTLGGVVAACDGGDETDSDVVGSADAITAILEWQAAEQEPVLDDGGEAQLPVIFVVAGEGASIDVGVQAEVVEAMVDTATIRFADDTGDTFDPDIDGEPVRDDGVMLLIGPLPEPARSVDVDVDRYLTIDDWDSFRLEITASASSTQPGDDTVSVATVTAVSPP